MRSKHVLIAAVVIALLLALPWVLSQFKSNPVRNIGGYTLPSGSIDGEYERVRAAGEPLTMDELKEWYKANATVPADDIVLAGKIYVHPDATIVDNVPLSGNYKDYGHTDPFPAAVVQALEKHLERNRQVLALLHKAAAAGACRYPITFADYFQNTTLEHLSKTRACVRLLAEEALYCAEKGDSAGATEALCTALGTASSLRYGVTLIEQLVRTACASIACDTTLRVVHRVSLSDADEQQLIGAYAKAAAERGYYYGLVGERAGFMTMLDARLGPGMEEAVAAMSAETGDQESLSQDYLDKNHDEEILCALDIWYGLVEAARMGLPEGAAYCQGAQEKLENVPEDFLLAKTMLPALGRSLDADARGVAMMRMAMTALAVLRFEKANGKRPDTLDELVPTFLDAVPIDPFDGEPLRYWKRGNRFSVYSVFVDKDDDGGTTTEVSSETMKDGDLAFIVEQ